MIRHVLGNSEVNKMSTSWYFLLIPVAILLVIVLVMKLLRRNKSQSHTNPLVRESRGQSYGSSVYSSDTQKPEETVSHSSDDDDRPDRNDRCGNGQNSYSC